MHGRDTGGGQPPPPPPPPPPNTHTHTHTHTFCYVLMCGHRAFLCKSIWARYHKELIRNSLTLIKSMWDEWVKFTMFRTVHVCCVFVKTLPPPPPRIEDREGLQLVSGDPIMRLVFHQKDAAV